MTDAEKQAAAKQRDQAETKPRKPQAEATGKPTDVRVEVRETAVLSSFMQTHLNLRDHPGMAEQKARNDIFGRLLRL